MRKIALITGSLKGLGREIAIGFAKQNIDLFLHYNNSVNDLDSMINEVSKYNISVFSAQLDFNNISKVERFFEDEIIPILEREKYTGIDYLINNAGVYEFDNLNKLTNIYIDTILNINFKAPLLLIKASMKYMNDNGRIINILSTTVKRPYKKMIAYGSSKAALQNASLALVEDFGKRNITINNIIPGLLVSDNKKVFKIKDSVIHKMYIKNYGIKRVGRGEDVLELILFLIKDTSGWISGENIEVSGGYLNQ